jgi:serine/threonine-protein kinase
MPEQLLGNRYRIIAKVGEGGMATVYQAEDTLLERKVAIKVLRDQYASDPSFVERFKQEARAAAGLTHQNIVSVYDVGSDEGKNYIVMEYVEGTDLKHLIVQGAPFTNARAISLILQILAGVGFAHSHGIIHRDLKPQNILVTSDGHAKVADFGIARAARAVQLTETGTVLGSVHYCSPEQAQGKPVEQTSDLYSVGVILYEMLTGQLPFEGEGALAVALKHLQEAPPAPSRINSRITPQLEVLVLKALAKDGSERYSSAEEMRSALLRYQQASDQSTVTFKSVSSEAIGGPAKASDPSARDGYRTVPLSAQKGRRRGFDWIALVLVIVIIGAIIGWIPLGQRVIDTFFSSAGSGTATPVATAAPGASVVPNLTGVYWSDADRQLTALGLKLVTVGEEYNDQYEMLMIISQNVQAGTQLAKQGTVEVVVSKGSKRVTVPTVTDQTFEQARETLSKIGLTARAVEEATNKYPVGAVFAQDPPGGRVVDRGSVVNVTVAKALPATATPQPTPTMRVPTPAPTPAGPPKSTITIPNLVGMEAEAANRLIASMGLQTTYITWQTIDMIDNNSKDFFKSMPVGAVVSQQPAAGTEVARGTTVNIAARKE